MNRGLWGGVLLLTLGGWVAGLAAQEGAWRPASQPSPPVPLAGTEKDTTPAAEIGQPIRCARPPAPATSPPPPLPAIVPVNFEEPATSPGPAPLPRFLSGPTPSIIAVSATLPSTFPEGPGGGEESEFATERPAGVAPRRLTAPNLPAPPLWQTPGAQAHAKSSAPATGLSKYLPSAPTGGVLVKGFHLHSGVHAAGATSEKSDAPDVWPSGPRSAPKDGAAPAVAAPAEATFNPWTQSLGAEGAFGQVPEASSDPCHNHCYVDAEYLLWSTKGFHVPALLTTSNQNDFGILGQPSTQLIFGNSDLDGGARSGFRFTLGGWIDCEGLGAEISGFFLVPKEQNFVANSGMFPVLGRPFFNVNTNAQFSELVALPGVTTGSAVINAPSKLWGTEANLLCNLCCSDCWRVNALAGFRYLDLQESLTITENIQGLPTAPQPFTNESIIVFDRFATHNQFYGGQVGVDARYKYAHWSLEVKGKLGIGATEQIIDINGGQRFVGPNGAVATARGGLLALPSNIGRLSEGRFSLVPELTATLGYQFTPHVRGFVGCNFLYWSNVVRPGDQIDPLLNVNNIPNFPTSGPASTLNRPLVPFRTSDFWAQGLVLGFEITF